MMERAKSLDSTDQNILRILSAYLHLTPLQLWYEIGEDDGIKERLREEEILDKLESLRAKGFVERVTVAKSSSDTRLLHYRVKTKASGEGLG